MKQIPYSDNNGNEFLADAILPCPCCGGESILTFKGNSHTKSRSVTIKCKKCRLQRTDAALRNDHEWCAKAAIEHWNERVNSVKKAKVHLIHKVNTTKCGKNLENVKYTIDIIKQKPNVKDFDLQPYGYIGALLGYIEKLDALTEDNRIAVIKHVCLNPRNENDNCDRREACEECGGCPYHAEHVTVEQNISTIDLDEIEMEIDETLNNETPESLKKWLQSKRKKEI